MASSTRASRCRPRSSTPRRSERSKPRRPTFEPSNSLTRAHVRRSCSSSPISTFKLSRMPAGYRRRARQVSTAETVARLAEDQRTSGLVAGIEVLRQQVQLAGARQRLIAAEAAAEKDKLALARSIGLPASQPIELADAIPFAAAPSLTLEEAIAEAYTARDDLRGAEAQVDAARAARQAAMGYALPTRASRRRLRRARLERLDDQEHLRRGGERSRAALRRWLDARPDRAGRRGASPARGRALRPAGRHSIPGRGHAAGSRRPPAPR